ncbi:triacylglycerol lipase-like protein [Ramaria rubella]|nr:triacylglycerol lipase-like protein [Ramaria rubella]
MLRKQTLLLISLCSTAASLVSLKVPAVGLGYATYEGTAQSNSQNQFLGIRSAAPPLGELRFRKPQPLTKVPAVQMANASRMLWRGSRILQLLERRLFIPSDTTPTSRHPVFCWIQGGGYIVNSDANYNGSELVKATGNQMVFVGINYRVGLFGFLSSERVCENGDLNVGLLDQRMAMEWVQEHITKFGGDPDHVIPVGSSAGVGSVAMHLIAFGGKPSSLFVGAFGLSPFFPVQLRVSELEWQFDLFVSRVGCHGVSDSLGCVRAQDTTVLQNANIGMSYLGRNGSALFPFTPAIDGEFLVDFPYRLFEEGRSGYFRVKDDTDEGTLFAVNVSSPEEVASFFIDQYPGLIHPIPMQSMPSFFPSTAKAFEETTFTCPGIEIASALAKHTKPWNYRYNVLTPSEMTPGFGVSHTSETPDLFGPGNTPAGSSTAGFDFDDISLTPILQAYYTSFVRALDPNVHQEDGSVFWPEFMPGGWRLLLQVNDTRVEGVPWRQLERCAFWKRLGVKMQQ